MIGQAAPGPYTENTRINASSAAPVNMIVPGLAWSPNTIVVKAGDTITLNITNCTTFQHNFVGPGLGVSDQGVNVPVAGDATVKFTAPSTPGKYMFWCSVKTPNGTHAERGQTGEVIVQ